MNEEKFQIYDDFSGMRQAGRLAREVLDFIAPYVQKGITTNELDKLCHDFIVSNKAIPAPLGYRGYPKSICTSINNVVCHGIPDQTKLQNGDILNIDVTVILDGWYGDTSRMFSVGKIPTIVQKLIDVTKSALEIGISEVSPGKHFGDIGEAIQKFVEGHGFSVVRDYCGHGIGRVFHTDPEVRHFGLRGEGPVMKEGMLFTIEPMVNIGKSGTRLLADGWTAVTSDRSLSAQFEHTIGVTHDGHEVLT